MKILVIDDNEVKRARVKQVLVSGFEGRPIDVIEAEDYEQAMRALEQSHFDLVILDLLLPGAGNEASLATSGAIIRNVLNGTAAFAPSHIIGLTAFKEVATQASHFYDENLLSLEVYSEVSNDWADRIVSKIRYLLKSKQAATSFQANSFDYDVVILVARYESEYRPIVEWLMPNAETTDHPLWQGKASFGHLQVPGHRTLRTIICCVGEMGMAPAAAMASQAITLFRPRMLAMLGMCCGFDSEECASPRKIMDAIVAREVCCWEEGKYLDQFKKNTEFKNRAKVRTVDDVIREQVGQAIEASVDVLQPDLQAFVQRDEYRAIFDHFGERKVRDIPNIQYAAIVSGSSVIADRNMVSEIIDRHPNALGLDMEMYGVYTAVERSFGRKPSVIGIKGIADFGDVNKDDRAQKSASQLSAQILKSLLPQLTIW